MSLLPGAVIRRAILFCCLLLAAGGCAATSRTVMDEVVISNQKYMASYKDLLIEDFELDSGVLASAGSDGDRSTRERFYAGLPGMMAAGIERHVTVRQTYRSVSRGGVPSGTTLVLKGKFTRIGRFRISLAGTLYDGGTGQQVASFRQTLWDVFDTMAAVDYLSRGVADFIDGIQYK